MAPAPSPDQAGPAASVPPARQPSTPSPGQAGPAASAPQSVVVTASHLSAQTLVDRKVYDVTTDLQHDSGTASDLLNSIPSVDVDGDGTVSLRGDANVLILVDGKPSALFAGSSAGENLQSIPATDIERIEVITDPPPQYKAEGAAGIINIITKRSHAAGLSGALQASVGAQGRYELGGSGAYAGGPLTVSLALAYRHDLRHRLAQLDLITPDPATGVLIDNRSITNETFHRAVPPVSLSVGYALDERDALSLELARSGRSGLRTYPEENTATLPAGTINQWTQRLSYGHDVETDYDAKLGYTRKLTRAGETLDFTLHHSSSHHVEDYDYTNDSFIPPATTYYTDLGFGEDDRDTEADADYTLPLSDSQKLKLGYAFEQQDSIYTAAGGGFDPATGAQAPDPNLTDDFHYRLDSNALYASWQGSVGAWDWLGGARGEYVQTQGRQLADGSVVTYDNLRLYPSVHLDRNLTEHSALSLGAARRVTWPDAGDLDPYIDPEYTPNLLSGNPHLRPEYTQSYEAGYAYTTQGTTYGVTGYYRRNTDTVTTLTENLGNGVSLTTAANLPRNDNMGAEFNASGHLLSALAYSLSGNLFRSQIDTSALGTPGLRSSTGVNGKLRLDYRPTQADAAQVMVSRTDKALTPQGYVGAINTVNLGYRHQFSRQFSGSLTITDLFDGQRFERVAVTPAFTEIYQRQIAGRVAWVGVRYTFDGAKEDKAPKFDYDQ